MSSNSYIVYSDGGCNPNPGGPGGFGTIILQDNIIYAEISQGFFSTTNNRMEIMGVVAALECLPEGSIVEKLYCDSQYVLKCISGEFSRKKNLDLWNRFDQAAKKVKIKELKWIKGHNNNMYNEKCDALATNALIHPSNTDTGYMSQDNRQTSVQPDRVSMSEIMEEMTLPIFYPNVNLNPVCKTAIEVFHKKKQHVFKDYILLKTGGKDIFSTAKISDIKDRIESIRPGVCDFIDSSGLSEKQKESAYRWIMRGLSPTDAVKKVQVDAEVTANAVKKSSY